MFRVVFFFPFTLFSFLGTKIHINAFSFGILRAGANFVWQNRVPTLYGQRQLCMAKRGTNFVWSAPTLYANFVRTGYYGVWRKTGFQRQLCFFRRLPWEARTRARRLWLRGQRGPPTPLEGRDSGPGLQGPKSADPKTNWATNSIFGIAVKIRWEVRGDPHGPEQGCSGRRTRLGLQVDPIVRRSVQGSVWVVGSSSLERKKTKICWEVYHFVSSRFLTSPSVVLERISAKNGVQNSGPQPGQDLGGGLVMKRPDLRFPWYKFRDSSHS